VDTVSLIIGLGFLAIFTLPFLFVRMANNKREKALMQRFLTVAQFRGVLISESELWNRNYVLGMDAQKENLVYLQLFTEGEKVEHVRLTTGLKVRVVRINKTTARNEEVIDRLELIIDGGSTQTVLEFYNSEVSNGLNDELKLVEKWKMKLG